MGISGRLSLVYANSYQFANAIQLETTLVVSVKRRAWQQVRLAKTDPQYHRPSGRYVLPIFSLVLGAVPTQVWRSNGCFLSCAKALRAICWIPTIS